MISKLGSLWSIHQGNPDYRKFYIFKKTNFEKFLNTPKRERQKRRCLLINNNEEKKETIQNNKIQIHIYVVSYLCNLKLVFLIPNNPYNFN